MKVQRLIVGGRRASSQRLAVRLVVHRALVERLDRDDVLTIWTACSVFNTTTSDVRFIPSNHQVTCKRCIASAGHDRAIPELP